MAHLQTEITNGPISTKSKATQTLLVQTQIPTQLISHEVHQFTQLVNHDCPEHVGGDTLLNNSDPERSGNTILLHDNDDDDDDDAQSGPSLKVKEGPPLQVQRDAVSDVTNPCEMKSGAGKTGLHVEGHHVAPFKLIDDSITPHLHRDLPHSDATTEEEGDGENTGYLDADAESQPTHFNVTKDNKGVHLGEKNMESLQSGAVIKKDNLVSQKTPESILEADMTSKRSSQSIRPSIASVRAESLHASGLRAASRGASIGLEGKDDVNLDLVTTLELTSGVVSGGLNKPLKAPETELENSQANKAEDVDSMQLSPKATLPFDGTMVRSPCMSTSRSKSRGVLQQHTLEQEYIDSDAMIVLNKNIIEGPPHLGRIIEKPESGIDNQERISAPLELPTLGLKRPCSQVSVVSARKLEQVDGVNDVNVKVQPRQPSHQKARKLVFDTIDKSPTTLADKLEEDPKAVVTEHDHASKNVINAPTRERQSSLPVRFHEQSANLSYLESQEPGEESQANALNIVDKLVWFDATCTSDDVVTSPVPQDSSVKGHAGSKGRQSLAQAAQMKTVHDKLDVFDWEDSQVDEGISPDTKQVPASTKARKRHLEAFESVTDGRKRAAHQQQKTETISPVDKTGYYSGKEKRTTPDVGKSEVPNVEPSTGKQEMKPHTFLTTRLRNRIKSESGQPGKGRKSPGLKSEPMKDVCKEKQIDRSVKDFEPVHQKGNDDKVQQAGLSIKSELWNRAHRKEVGDESGKELELEHKNRKGRKLPQADSLSAKSKRAPFNSFEVGPQIQGHLALADQTSQDDAAADLWIEAFTNTKNKTPAGCSVEVIKFRKRSALHEHTRQDSKKCRITETVSVSCNDEDQDVATEEEASMKKNRVKPRLSIQHAPKGINAAESKGRRVGTRFSQNENQDIEKKEDKMQEQLTSRAKQNSKEPRVADTSMLPQVKGRRVCTRNSQGEYQYASRPEEKPMAEDKAEGGPRTRQGRKECKTANGETLPIKSRGASTCGGAAEYTQMKNVREDDMLERGSKTRSRAQNVKSVVVASNVKEGIRARKAAMNSSTSKATADDTDEPSMSRGAVPDVFDTSSSKKKESLRSHQHLTAKLTPDAQEIEVNACKVGSSGLVSPPLEIDVSIGALTGGPRKSKRRGESCVVNVPESTKGGENSGSRLKERDKDKLLPKVKDPDCKQGDVSSMILLRRTRSSLCDGGSQRNDAVDTEKNTIQILGDPATDEQSLQKRIDSSDAKNRLTKQVAKSATKATNKSISHQIKKTRSFEMLNSSNLVDEGRRRKRESGCIHVLFSHSLTEETIKHQKKILAKLGGQLAISASDCTHFVSNGFTRSQNMLVSMAAGKEVVTTLWLENCGQAHYFVDEKTYILQDVKKEKEFGFSMVTSLASARRKPLLKGVCVLVSPNTVPEPAVLKAIVESGGGQVMDTKLWSPHLDEKESDTIFIIVANEKDFCFCIQFLDKGLKVYSEELLLHGIVTQTLDFSRYRLFENFKQHKGPRRVASIKA